MTQAERWVGHHGERDLIKGFQPSFSRRLSCGPFGMASVQAGQDRARLDQASRHHTLQQGQDAQGDGEHAHQPAGMLIALDVPGREREGMADPSPDLALDQLLVALAQPRLPEAQVGGIVVGGLHAPAQLGPCLLQGEGVELTGAGERSHQPHAGCTAPRGSHGLLGHRFVHRDLQQALSPSVRKPHGDGWLTLRSLHQPRFAAPGHQQLGQCALGTAQPRRQGLLTGLGQGQRGHQQAWLRPGDPLSVDLCRKRDRLFIALGDAFWAAIGPCTLTRQPRLPTAHRGSERLGRVLWGHDQGPEGAQGLILAGVQLGTGRQGGPLAVAHIQQAVPSQAGVHAAPHRQAEVG
jgi:hypothetical protein